MTEIAEKLRYVPAAGVSTSYSHETTHEGLVEVEDLATSQINQGLFSSLQLFTGQSWHVFQYTCRFIKFVPFLVLPMEL